MHSDLRIVVSLFITVEIFIRCYSNAVHYETGPLTTVSSPVLITEAVLPIPTISRIRSSWLLAAQNNYEGLMSAGF